MKTRVEGALLTFLLLGLLAYFYIVVPLRLDDQSLTPQDLFWLLISIYFFDRFLTFLHLFRKPVEHEKLECEPDKVSVIIAAHNSQEVIGETVRQVLTHGINPKNVIVVSDASSDKTADVAKSYGVTVILNQQNLQKGLSISRVIGLVSTPYVLLLDDDTRVEGMTIPTNLMKKYAAVSFTLLPLQSGNLIFDLQAFEYRRSMIMSKELRGSVGGVGNVSGAIGLFKTNDLRFQAERHSGQVGGEDQQRTAMVHLYSPWQGVTHVQEVVQTIVPSTWRTLFRQRAFRWNRAVPDNFWLFWRMLWSPKVPLILKFDRMQALFIFLTEPIRILGWSIALLSLGYLSLYAIVFRYCISILWNLAIYAKTGRKDPLYVVIVYPLYSAFRECTRYIAHFHWLYAKYQYVFKRRYHKLISQRSLVKEYAAVFCIMLIMWIAGIAVYQIKIDRDAKGVPNIVKKAERGALGFWQENIAKIISPPPVYTRPG